MLKVNIPESDIALLKYERYHNPHPRVMQKMEALYLKALEYPNEDICKIADICGNTMRDYFKQYMEGGVERLKEINFYRPTSELKEYSGTIEDYFKKNPPSSITEASAKIEELTGIKRGETQVRKFLKSLGFRHIKACSIPAKALTEEKKKNRGNSWKKTSNLD
jgi:transposase